MSRQMSTSSSNPSVNAFSNPKEEGNVLERHIGSAARGSPFSEVRNGNVPVQNFSPRSPGGGNAMPLRPVVVDQLNPVVISKKSLQNVVFKQPISIRYLKPPTPPPPGPIVIRERRPAVPPPPPPKIVRQHINKPPTPVPLVVRERPPTPPSMLKPVVIEKRLPAPPAHPQQVIIERFVPPRKPRQIIFEKWLPYEAPRRKIILQKAPPLPQIPKPRNVVVEYSSPTTLSVPEYKIEGIYRADPLTYTYSEHTGQLKVVDKIYDIPPPRVLKESLDLLK
ncbi:hypothetical protein ACOME3_009235 [Neoechinorhynchus agilis]